MPERRVIHAVAVCGPTASGKSAAAARAAAALGGEIVNADSRQVYEGMRIGTGWPDAAALAAVPHHGYGLVSPAQRYSAGRFVVDASRFVADIAARGKLPILVGGTGLYLAALDGSMPLDRAVASAQTKERVAREARVHPAAVMREWLAALDTVAAARVPPGDAYRTLRALEAVLARRAGDDVMERPPFAIRLTTIVLTLDKDTLRRRIEERTRAMFAGGLIEEAVAIARRHGDAPALSGLGYAEALAYHGGSATLAEAIAAASRRAVRYAKRQRTWFMRLRAARVVDASDVERVIAAITDAARESRAPA